MNRAFVLFALLAGLGAGSPSYSQELPQPQHVPDLPYLAQLPPLIDRALFFGDPQYANAQLAPDGRFIAFLKPYNDVMNLWVKGLDEPFEDARPVTADERPVPGYFWSRDGAYLLYVQDKGGNEDFHVYAVDPAAAGTGVPPARDLTPLEGIRALIYAVPEERPGEIIVGLNDRDPAYHDVYRVDLETGERTLLIENTEQVGAYLYDDRGDVRFAYKQKPGGGFEMLDVAGDGSLGEVLYACDYTESCFPVGFHADNQRLYMQTNKGDRDLSELVLFDPATQTETFVDRDPEGSVDLGGAVFSEDEELLATYYVGDRLRIYPKDDQFARDLEQVRAQLPEGELSFSSHTKDETRWIVTVQSDVDPGSAYLYNRETGEAALLYRSRPELPSDQLAEMKPIRYQSRDGRDIPAYLTVPKGVAPESLSVILHPHGGPWGRDTWGYNPYVQFLANRGYAVLQPNFRSSTGYGKDFLNAGNKTWGTGAMQHDLTDGVQYLIDQGIADPGRVGIFGGSYGGYATLAGVTFTPDRYAAAVAYVAPSSLITLIESFPAYWRPFLETSWYKRVGDPANPADREDLEQRSPLNYVDRIKTPLLVVHGANDPRVTQRESDQLVVALRDRDVDVEYLVAPDEGHGFRSDENRLAMAAAMERFLATHLGGRYQKEMPEEIRQQLDALTVDVSTVALEQPVAAGEDVEQAALPASDGSLLRPATATYQSTIQTAGQTLELTTARAIETDTLNGLPAWRVTDTTQLPPNMGGGTAVDTFWVDRTTLSPLRRNSMMGMMQMTLTYSDDKIRGTMTAGQQDMPVDVALDAPVLGEDNGLVMALAGLPLAPAYEAFVRIFSPQTQKVRPMKLTVEGTETMEVPAGAFETYVVSLKPLDGDEAGTATLHLMKEAPHYVVRGELKLPAMQGGGTFITELAEMEQRGSD